MKIFSHKIKSRYFKIIKDEKKNANVRVHTVLNAIIVTLPLGCKLYTSHAHGIVMRVNSPGEFEACR